MTNDTDFTESWALEQFSKLPPELQEKARLDNPGLFPSSVPSASPTTGIKCPAGATSRETHSTGSGQGKYGAIRTPYNGVMYDSKAEARKAQELDLAVKAGEIDFWLRQVAFSLPGGIVYRADFVTFKHHWIPSRDVAALENPVTVKMLSKWDVRVIEVKGFAKRPDWRMKFKLFKERYPNLTLEVVK